MSTKTTLLVLQIWSSLVLLLIWMGRVTGNHVLTMLCACMLLPTFGLLFYAWYREQSGGGRPADRSPSFSIQAMMFLLGFFVCGIGFIIIHKAAH